MICRAAQIPASVRNFVLRKIITYSMNRTTFSESDLPCTESALMMSQGKNFQKVRNGKSPFSLPAHYASFVDLSQGKWQTHHGACFDADNGIRASYWVCGNPDRVPPVILYSIGKSENPHYLAAGGLYGLPLLEFCPKEKLAVIFRDALSVQPPERILRPEILLLLLKCIHLLETYPLLRQIGSRFFGRFFSEKPPTTSKHCNENGRQVTAEPVLLSAFTNNFGHFLWNEMTGLHLLAISGFRFNEIIIGPYNFAGNHRWVSSLFPQTHITADPLSLAKNSKPRIVRSKDLLLRFNELIISDKFIDSFKMGILGQMPAGTPSRTSLAACFKLRLHDRRCLNHREVIIRTVQWLSKINSGQACPKRLTFYIDGMTHFSGIDSKSRELLEAEKKEFLALAAGIDQSLGSADLISLIGSDLSSKAKIAATLDQYIAPIGSGSEFYGWIFKVPGIYFGPQRMVSLARDHLLGIVESPPEIQLIQPVEPIEQQNPQEDYCVDPAQLKERLLRTRFFSDLTEGDNSVRLD